LKPDVALSSWRQWQCELRSRPVIVRQLTGGKTNQSYLLESADLKLVMRLNAPADALPGVDRASEALIWQEASNAIDRLVSLLATVHELDINVPVLNYAVHIEKFWQLIESRPYRENVPLLQRREPMRELVEDFMASATDIGLCHHDPVTSNVVRKDTHLYLLDWEYAARGPVAMDYAALSVEWNIGSAEIVDRVALEPALLETAKTVYQYLCQLWNEVRA